MGYSVTSALAGVLIAKFGYDLLFLLHVILFAVVIVIVLFIPGVPCGNARKKKVEGAQLQPEQGESLSFGGIIKMLLRNQKYMVFLLSTFCFYMALKAWCTYIPYKIIELGGADKELGYEMCIRDRAGAPPNRLYRRAEHALLPRAARRRDRHPEKARAEAAVRGGRGHLRLLGLSLIHI